MQLFSFKLHFVSLNTQFSLAIFVLLIAFCLSQRVLLTRKELTIAPHRTATQRGGWGSKNVEGSSVCAFGAGGKVFKASFIRHSLWDGFSRVRGIAFYDFNGLSMSIICVRGLG